jgi:hypothetical protein
MDNAVRFLSANATGENDYKVASFSSSGVINFRYLVADMGLRQVLSNVKLLYSPDVLVRWLSIYRRAFFKRKLRHRVIGFFMVMACFTRWTMAFHAREQFRKGEGVIGVWDVDNNYRRGNKFKSCGIGPHELIMPDDGRTLAVANGGMLTHPDTGLRKLNICRIRRRGEVKYRSLRFIGAETPN